MKQVRALGLLLVCAFSFWGPVSKADGYLRVRDTQLLVEHLVRTADAILSEVNLVRAGGFVVAPVVVQSLPQRSWEGSFYQMILANPQMPVDAQVATQLQALRVNALMFYDLSYKLRPGDPRLVDQFARLNRAYHNALAATFFEIEALRRTYIVRGCPGRTPYIQTLVRRLRNMEALAHQLMEVMHIIRHCATFHFQLPRTCMECGRANVHIKITVAAPQQFVQIPYYASNQWYTPAGADMYPHSDQYRPNYDLNGNTQRWTYYPSQDDGGYDSQPQPAPYGGYSGNQQPGNQPPYSGQGGYQGGQPPYSGQQGGYGPQQGNQPLPPPQSGDNGVVPSRDYDL